MADSVTIYHNPRCSKSCQTLALLKEQHIDPEIVYYLETPPTNDELRQLLEKLGLTARDVLRRTETAYEEHGLSNPNLTEDELLAALVAHPRLLQRPIVVRGDQAVLGRPPERVLDLL